jgi:hypothetical protein
MQKNNAPNDNPPNGTKKQKTRRSKLHQETGLCEYPKTLPGVI